MIVRKKSHTVTFLKLHVLALLATLFVGCASGGDGPNYLPESDTYNTGESTSADNITFRKSMPKHADSKPLDFYYKHCTEMGEASFYSKTSYECSAPY